MKESADRTERCMHAFLRILGLGRREETCDQISFEVFGPDHPAVQVALDPPFPWILPPDFEPANPDPALELLKDL